jgi:hypothetical protein
MPIFEPINHPARLDEMADELFRQRDTPALSAADGLELREAARLIRRDRMAEEILRAIVEAYDDMFGPPTPIDGAIDRAREFLAGTGEARGS